MLEPPVPIADPVRRRRITLAVALILMISAALRLWQVATPAEYMFDEVYYAKDAKAIVDGRVGPKAPLRWEAGDEVSWPHPEMGKFAIAAGIVLFGDRAFGWRLPAVIAGLVTLACVYPLARRLGLPPPWALIALGFAAADTLGIAQSRIATLDVFVGVWSVLCILLALRYAQGGRHKRWLVLCAAAGGMAVATKWSGGLALVAAAILIFLVWLHDREPVAEDDGAEPAYLLGDVPTARSTFVGALPGALLVVALFILIPAALYVFSYVQYFASGHTLADWRELQRQAAFFSLHLKAVHTYASAAPTWIVDYRPVWYYFEGGKMFRGVIAMGNPFLWWVATLGLIAAPILALLRRTTLLLPTAIVVAVLYVPWFATSRTSFIYYMTPVAPFLAILAAAALVAFAGSTRLPRHGVVVMAATAVATAVLWDPVARLAVWFFWRLPRSVSPTVGWIDVGVGIFLALFLVIMAVSPWTRRWRPVVSMILAGAIVGIAVAFLPIVLNIPISPGHWSHIMWFRSWI
ncbi:MAG: glycosyltransferase family 39 protein [Actinobacteria bacterium]|nr:glycosyltransferase family 39 protein [Actinomycetota bacterium]